MAIYFTNTRFVGVISIKMVWSITSIVKYMERAVSHDPDLVRFVWSDIVTAAAVAAPEVTSDLLRMIWTIKM